MEKYTIINTERVRITKCKKCKQAFALSGLSNVCFLCPLTQDDLTMTRTGVCSDPNSYGYCSCSYGCSSGQELKFVLRMEKKCSYCNINTENLRPVGYDKLDFILKACCCECSGLVNEQQMTILSKIKSKQEELEHLIKDYHQQSTI